jgi:hypothetical protein
MRKFHAARPSHTRARPCYEHQAKSQDHDCRLKICGLALLLIGVIGVILVRPAVSQHS